ncbi:MAG: hypothetical protein ABFS42_12115 [Candidatus Krumholzibacteriota bacterium]
MCFNSLKGISLLAVIILAVLAGCGDDDPVSVTCPGPTVEDLTPVQNLTITDDPFLHARVTVTWESPLPNPADLAVEKFEVRVHKSGGSITAENWCTLPVLGSMPSGNKLGYFMTFDHRDKGIVPGVTESFAVRPVYENGDPGPVGTVVSHRPTAPFTVEGLVRDDTTAPIPGMTVRLMEPFEFPEAADIVTSVETGPDGRFPPLGPISDLAAMVVATDSPDTLTTPDAEDSFFDFTTEPITADTYEGDITITLITRYTYEFPPGGWLAEYFVGWVQLMTYTNYAGGGYRLRKWDDYDLRVYVPEGMNEDGTIDLAAECRQAMETWNTALGLTVFTETTDPADAKIEVQYLDLRQAYGRIMLDLPAGHTFNGWVIPERALLQLDPIINHNNASGVILHEFGHTLGIYSHSGNPNHLMSTAGSCCLGQDEIRLVHTIMNLPQNCLTSNFEKAMPWPWPPGPQ